jgi:MoaA/NifB/PqqE/SkfB family radical SAM enzyme
MAERLVKMKLLYIQVSLDGAKAATNDAIRGEGTYDRILKALDLLTSAGFQNLRTNTVVTTLHVREILNRYELGRSVGR